MNGRSSYSHNFTTNRDTGVILCLLMLWSTEFKLESLVILVAKAKEISTSSRHGRNESFPIIMRS